MYQCQLNFALFCATSSLGISWQHLNRPNLLVRSVYRFHVYFYVRLILNDLDIPLQHEDSFSKVKNAYIKSAYYSICDDYGVDSEQTWMHGDWFYMAGYGIFGHKVRAIKRSPPDNLMRWIITRSKSFTRKGIEKISRSVRAYVFLVLASHVQPRSSMGGNSTPAVMLNKSLKDIEKYQGVLDHALSKVDFSVGTRIYMLPSYLNLSIGKTKEYNNKLLVSNTGMKIGLNKDINKDHKKLTPQGPGKAEGVAHDTPKIMRRTDKPVKDHLATVKRKAEPSQHDPVGATKLHNLKMLTEKHNNEKLAIKFLIVGTRLIAYHFW